MAAPSPASALDWNGLWHNSEQQAYRQYQQQNYQDAAEGFKDPRWKASSHYQGGDYDAALKELPQAESADDWYNRGNMLARNGQLQQALDAYDKALEQNPALTDVKENRKIVEEALKQQEQQQQNHQNQENPQQDQSDKQQKNDAQQADQQGDQNQQGQKQNSPQDQQQKDQAQQSQPQQNTQNGQDPQQSQDAQTSQDQPGKGQQADQRDHAAAQAQQQETAAQKTDQQPTGAQSRSDDEQQSPEDQQLQQYLQRIPDDPGGLLKRKFQFEQQYLYNGGEPQEDDQPW